MRKRIDSRAVASTVGDVCHKGLRCCVTSGIVDVVQTQSPKEEPQMITGFRTESGTLYRRSESGFYRLSEVPVLSLDQPNAVLAPTAVLVLNDDEVKVGSRASFTTPSGEILYTTPVVSVLEEW